MNQTKNQTEGLLLRPVNWLTDQARIVQIEEASFAHPWSIDKFELFRSYGNSKGMVAVIGGRVVGYTLLEQKMTWCHVAHIAVDPQYQKLGIGRLMIGAALESNRCLTLNVRRTNHGALKLYRQLGFSLKRVIPAHYTDGEDAFVMQCGQKKAPAKSYALKQLLLKAFNKGQESNFITAPIFR